MGVSDSHQIQDLGSLLKNLLILWVLDRYMIYLNYYFLISNTPNFQICI
ncbi:hypothetical protein CNEO2_180037 [Clostridium neonatale]|nr:hypothetical protein CNEO2_180037 [Clostridium neonatale]